MDMERIRTGLARTWRENWPLLLVLAVIFGGLIYFRTSASAVDSVQAVDSMLAGGQPTLVEFYSNT